MVVPLPRGMEKRILTRTLAVTIVPLVLLGVIAALAVGALGRSHDERVGDTRDSLAASVVGRDLARSAQSIRGELDRFVDERLADTAVWAATPTVLAAIQPSADPTVVGSGDAAAAYLATEISESPYFVGATLTDASGEVIAAVGAATDDPTAGSMASTSWWTAAWDDGLHLAPAATDDNGTTSLLVARVDHPTTGAPQGVLAAELDLDLVGQVAERFAAETDAQVTIVGPDGLVLVDTADAVNAGTSVDELDLATSAAVAAAATDRAGSRVEDGWVHGFSSSPPEGGPSWIVAVRQPESLALAPLADIDAAGDDVRTTSDRISRWLLGGAAVLALAVVVALALVARAVVRPLRRLRDTTRAAADERLPRIMDDIGHADRPDGVAIVPRISVSTGDELEDLADSFNKIQQAAVHAAVEARSSVPDVVDGAADPTADATFVALGRRDRELLRRHAEHLDILRGHVGDPGLPTLGHLDRLSMRLQRNTENLLVLADERLPPRDGGPVPIREVLVLGATVLDGRERIMVPALDPVVVTAEVAADLSHLLAELLENALAFSRPDTPVQVHGRLGPDGYRLTITDHGIGIADHQLAVANARLRGDHPVRPDPTTRLGLHVVGRLSRRHDITVTLRPGDPDGIVVGLVLPLDAIDAPPKEAIEAIGPESVPATGSDPLPSSMLASIVAEVAAAVAPDPAPPVAPAPPAAATPPTAREPTVWPEVFSPIVDGPLQAPPVIEPRD